MAVRAIVRAGDPVLARIADPVADPTADSVARLVGDMLDTLDLAGVAGIAAPQIGVSRRVVIYFLPPHRASGELGDEPVGMTVLVNPEVRPLGEERVTDWEGCLSLPDLRGRVPRWRRIRLLAFDLDGQRSERVLSGTHARIVQHECDHLDGRLYPSRMSDPASLGFVDELEASGALPRRVPVRPKHFLAGQAALLARLARAGVPVG
jgi:peptide deformylase